MTEQPTYDVFISYSSADKEWVRKELLSRLERAGLKTFIDFRDFEPGAPSVSEMERGVLSSRKTLLVLTPAYVKSQWTEFENLMLQTLDPAARQRRLLPLLRETTELPLRIRALTYVDFTDPGEQDLAWTRLLKALGVPDQPSAERPTPPSPAEPPGRRARPAMGGDSISHADSTAATLGCLVTDRDDPSCVYLLSDFTGLCRSNGPSRVGDPVLQPGRADGGSRATDVIATLTRWKMLKDDASAAPTNISAAVAQVRKLEDVSPEIRGRGPLKGVREAEEGMAVFMVGRTSGAVSGTVLRVDSQLEIPSPLSQIEGGTRSTGAGDGFAPVVYAGLIECSYMLGAGDCGAILLDTDNYALGLGFAGSDEVSLFLPIQRVLDALNVDLVTEGNWPPKKGASEPKPQAPATEPPAPTGPDILDLRRKLIERTSVSDLQDVCFVMGINYDNYPTTHNDFIREFLEDLKRQGRLAELVKTLNQEKTWVLR